MHQTADCIIKLMARKAICKDMQTSSAVVNMGCSLFPFKLCDAMPAVVLKFVSTVCISDQELPLCKVCHLDGWMLLQQNYLKLSKSSIIVPPAYNITKPTCRNFGN